LLITRRSGGRTKISADSVGGSHVIMESESSCSGVPCFGQDRCPDHGPVFAPSPSLPSAVASFSMGSKFPGGAAAQIPVRCKSLPAELPPHWQAGIAALRAVKLTCHGRQPCSSSPSLVPMPNDKARNRFSRPAYCRATGCVSPNEPPGDVCPLEEVPRR
jgi:hypothetical protein